MVFTAWRVFFVPTPLLLCFFTVSAWLYSTGVSAKPLSEYADSLPPIWKQVNVDMARVSFTNDPSGSAIIGDNPLNTDVDSPLIYYTTQAENCFDLRPKGQYQIIKAKINDSYVNLLNLCQDNDTALLVPANNNDRLIMLWNAVLRQETTVAFPLKDSSVMLTAGKYTSDGFRTIFEAIYDHSLSTQHLAAWTYNASANNAIAPVYSYFFGSSVSITDNGRGKKVFNLIVQVGDACTTRDQRATRFRGFQLDNTPFNMNFLCIGSGYAMLLPHNYQENSKLIQHLRHRQYSVIYGGGTLGKIGRFSSEGLSSAVEQVEVK